MGQHHRRRSARAPPFGSRPCALRSRRRPASSRPTSVVTKPVQAQTDGRGCGHEHADQSRVAYPPEAEPESMRERDGGPADVRFVVEVRDNVGAAAHTAATNVGAAAHTAATRVSTTNATPLPRNTVAHN